MARSQPYRGPLSARAAITGLLTTLLACSPLALGSDHTAGDPPRPLETVISMPGMEGEPPQAPLSPSLPPGPLTLTVQEAILLALENNRALAAERLNPAIVQTFEDEERAVFDPIIAGEVSTGRRKAQRQARAGSQTESFSANTSDGVLSLDQYFPTGTTLALEAGTEKSDSDLYDDPFYASRLGMSVTQALLRGFGPQVNLVRLRQARIDTRFSAFELRGFSESLVAEVEGAFWDYALAKRRIEIVEESLKVVRQQRRETEELIAVGRLARAELAAVQAEVAAQEQALIEARAARETSRLQLLRLLNPPVSDLWQREVEPVYPPSLPEIELEPVDAYVDVAKRLRPALNEARLLVQRGDLELVRTRNGLLPLMELFVTLGKSGYADSFGRSVDRIDDDNYDVLGGVRVSYPIFNRAARAEHRRAALSREQAQKALDNLSQLVEVDVRTAYIEVDRTRRQIAATSVTRRFNEETLRNETEKLRVGKSTNFLVAQAQRDLLVSRINEVEALVNYLKALIDLYRLDGSLLERRGISAPGREPVAMTPQARP